MMLFILDVRINGSNTSISSGGTGTSATMATGTDYYFEVKRIRWYWNISRHLLLRTGSHGRYSTLQQCSVNKNVPATVKWTMNYIQHRIYASGDTNENGSGRIAGTLDDFEFYNKSNTNSGTCIP